MKKYIIASSAVLIVFASIVSAQIYPYSRDLTVGMSGQDVTALQTWLVTNGYDIPAISSKAASYGYFGAQTKLAVMAYQRAVGLPSFGYFGRLTRAQINNGQSSVHAPTITSIDGPTSLAVNQAGTWTIRALNATSVTGNLNYSVTWGDENTIRPVDSAALPAQSLVFIQNATFTHSYSTAGIYTVKFVVRNDRGFMATKNVTVNVGNVAQPTITITSPNGGETWVRGTTQNVTWTGSSQVLSGTGHIILQPYVPPCAEATAPIRCMIAVQAPFSIATGINLGSGSYSWTVGNVIPDTIVTITSSSGRLVSDGQYKIIICSTQTNSCDSSNAYFNITSNTTGNLAPVISGIDAPTSLTVGQTGTWTVRATDPQGGTLSYAVDWGDSTVMTPSGYLAGLDVERETRFLQSSSFVHVYGNAGTYTVLFTVKNSLGLTSQSSVTVRVTGN